MYGVFQLRPDVQIAIENNTFVPRNYSSPEFEARDLYQSALRQHNLERLEVADCVGEYSQPFQSSRGLVFLVPTANSEDLQRVKHEYTQIKQSTGCGPDPGNNWVFQQFYRPNGCARQDASTLVPELQANTSIWRPFGAEIDHCLSQPAKTQCKLQFSIHLLAIVIAFNVLKCAAILFTVRALGNSPILTIGDAIASFLSDPDRATAGVGLLSQKDVLQSKGRWRDQPPIKQINGTRTRWMLAVKRQKMITCFIA